MIYLDSAATTLIKPERVGREMLSAMRLCASPGRGGHKPSMRAADVMLSMRETAASLFGLSEPEKTVMTCNATHALNIAVNSLVKPGDRVVISGYEHNSVYRPLIQRGARVDIAACPLFDTDGCIDAFRKRIRGAKLVVCTHVSNVFGFILPVYEIGELCRENGVPYIVDASQSAGVLNVDFSRLNADFIAMPGHKSLYGPQGTGLLLCRTGGKPLMSGGSGSDSLQTDMPDYLPDRLEAGTHNVPGAAGLRAGMEYVMQLGTDRILKHEQKLCKLMAEKLKEISGLEVFSSDGGSQTGVLSFRTKRGDCEELCARLAERGICLRAGLHCAPVAHRTAGTIDSGTIRASFSTFSTEDDAEHCVRTIKELMEK